MTDHPNLEIARAGYAAFASGELATVMDLFSDDIVWHIGGNNILAGVYEGKEAVLGYLGRLMQETGGSFKNDIHDLLANDEHCVALVSSSSTRGGKSFEGNAVHVLHMRDGKVTEYWSLHEDQSLVDEFWA
jgi:hypothetical protein